MAQGVDYRDQAATAERQSVCELVHDIRNPLASIQGVADAFLRRGQLTGQEREWMEAVRSEVSKIYLDLTRIENAVLNLGLNAVESIDRNGRDIKEGTDPGFVTVQGTKRGRPQRQTASPLGKLIVKAMKLLGLTYKDVVSESERLAKIHNNSDMRIGKSTLGNIISGSIRQPGTAKLDSLHIVLNLSRGDIDVAMGLQPERRFAEQLEMSRARTHELPIDVVMRHRKIRLPVLREDADLKETQFFEGSLKGWAEVEVEYLSSFFPPHFCYVVVGEDDANAGPIAPPGSRLLVNKLLNKVQPSSDVSFHKRELFYVMTPTGFTCVYAELAAGDKIVLIPHPASGKVREEFNRKEITIIGQVVGVLYPRQ
jgi:hypothetical protein